MHRTPFGAPIWPLRPRVPAQGIPPAGVPGGAPGALPAAPGPGQQAPASWRAHPAFRRIVPRTRQQTAAPATNKHFDGQLANEHVIWIKRRSWLYLLTSGWPLLAGFLLLALVSLVGGAFPALRLLQVIGLLALLGYAIWWVATAWWEWYFEYYILTDQRIIKTAGYPHARRQEIGQKSVAQVLVASANPFAVFFDVGDVEVRPVGNSILLRGVRHPRDVGDSILDMVEAKEKSKGEAPPPKVANPKLQAALDQLAQPKPMPAAVPMLRSSRGNFLQRKIPLRLIDDEELLDVVYRHWFVLLRNELPAIGLVVGGIAVGTLLGATVVGMPLAVLSLVGGVLGGLFVGGLIYLNWADDVFILTTHRVVDIDRLFFILAEYSNDAPYARVQHVQVEQSLIGHVLGFGSILVQTSGRKNPLHMSDIPHAFAIMDRIFEQIHLIRERESVSAINKQRKENYRWLATTLNDLLVSVPDLRGLSLLEAIARAQQAGLRLVVESERPSPNVPASHVLDQVPLAGTSALTDSEVRVSVSGRGVPVAP